MRKIIKLTCFLLAFFIIFSFGCKQENPLYNSVSELRSDLYEGKGENFSVMAFYGFKETPFNNDAAVGDKVYMLTFRLLNNQIDDATYTLSTTLNGQNFEREFKLNPVSHALTQSIEIENFSLKEFDVTITCGAISEKIKLTSIVPNNTISYKTALDRLYSEQKELVKVYTDQNGNFNAEIYTRIVVKDQKPYWYVGIASGNENLKALLIDGFSGEILAIRDIF